MPSRVWISCWRPGQQTLKPRRSQPEHDANRCSELVTGDGTRGLLTLKFLTPGYMSTVKYCNLLDQVTEEIRKLKLQSTPSFKYLQVSGNPSVFSNQTHASEKNGRFAWPVVAAREEACASLFTAGCQHVSMLHATLGIYIAQSQFCFSILSDKFRMKSNTNNDVGSFVPSSFPIEARFHPS